LQLLYPIDRNTLEAKEWPKPFILMPIACAPVA
jgi:hypothetical protein